MWRKMRRRMRRKMRKITPGRRPAPEEIRDYYTRPEILREIRATMARWHVCYLPGYAPQRWLTTETVDDLRSLLAEPLNRMAEDPARTEYPYFRINYARYHPAHSWDEAALWGYDFVIEKDHPLWQACFEAMLPVMDILDDFGVHYWLKYTGHHSLHLVIPAEAFPATVRGVPLTACRAAIHHRLMVFLNKRAAQARNDHDRHCPPGTNMPYSVNEDTGLVNTPLVRADLADFRPWQASIHTVEIHDLWRTVPDTAHGSAAGLLDEVLKPFHGQAPVYPAASLPTKPRRLPAPRPGKRAEAPAFARARKSAGTLPSRCEALDTLRHGSTAARQRAAWALLLTGDATAPALIKALHDPDADVRWFATEALLAADVPAPLDDLLAMAPDDMAGAAFADHATRTGAAAVPALVDGLRTDFNHFWNSLPIDQALVRIGAAARPALAAMAHDPDRDQRAKALAILTQIEGTPSLEEVLAMSHNPRTTSKAAKMLGWFDDPRAWQRIAELCSEPHNVRARRDALQALLWTDHPQTHQLVHRALDDPHRKVRRLAERSLDLVEQLDRLLPGQRSKISKISEDL